MRESGGMSGHESLVKVKEKLARQTRNTVQLPFADTWMRADKSKQKFAVIKGDAECVNMSFCVRRNSFASIYW